MNNVEKLLKIYQGETIWFYLSNDDVKESFKKELVELNVNWNDQTKFSEDHHVSYTMAVHQDKTVAFISAYIWSLSFQLNDKHIKVDYKKYIEGSKDYLIKKSNMQPVEPVQNLKIIKIYSRDDFK